MEQPMMNAVHEGKIEETVTEQIKQTYKQNQPFEHVVLEHACDTNLLRAVRQELITNFSANLKETDLFKVSEGVRELGSEGGSD